MQTLTPDSQPRSNIASGSKREIQEHRNNEFRLQMMEVRACPLAEVFRPARIWLLTRVKVLSKQALTRRCLHETSEQASYRFPHLSTTRDGQCDRSAMGNAIGQPVQGGYGSHPGCGQCRSRQEAVAVRKQIVCAAECVNVETDLTCGPISTDSSPYLFAQPVCLLGPTKLNNKPR
jgi:hypothetical protein